MYHLKEGTYLLEGKPVQKQAAAATATMLWSLSCPNNT